MAEINNSLAASINSQPLDLGKTLLTVGQLKEMQAKTALEEASTTQTQQNTDYNAFQQSQNGGYRAPEVNTLAEAHTKQLGIQGQIGNMMTNAKTKEDRLQAIQASEDAGKPVSSLVKQHLLDIPLSKFQQYGRNMQAAGQSSTSNVEQNPGQIAQRSQASTGGSLAGSIYGAPGATGYQPPKPTATPTSGEGTAPDVSLLEKKGAAEGAAQLSQEQIKRYGLANESAANQKVALRQIMLDADKVRTGAGSYNEQALRKWTQAAAEYIPGLKDVAGQSIDKQIAAFEGIEKNGGLVSREAMKGVGGTAASELSAISNTLVGTSTSHGGIANNASQLIGLKNSEMARYQAAQDYLNKNQTLKGFDAQFAKNAGPAAWVYMALPAEERQSIRDSLNKTDQGKGILNSIARQMNYIHTHKLDEGLE